MGKSSSTKGKRSKYSSPVRRKKRSKVKTVRSKKLRHLEDLVSYSSKDSSSVSVSSSSEDSYRHRRSRSCTHKDGKATRRKACSCSSGIDESRSLIKHKRSRRIDNSDVRKKSYGNKTKKKKKKAVEPSISSWSSGSKSCSTCWSSSSSSGESEHESRKETSERRQKKRRVLKNVKNGTDHRRYRSRSCSSCSRHDGCSDHKSEEKVIDRNIPKRLKSVIMLPRESNVDEHKEEMICDQDDYPSRSNDSNDGGNKRVSTYYPSVESEEKQAIEFEKKEDTSAFSMKTTELPNISKDWVYYHVGSKSACEGVGTNDATKESTFKISKAAVNVTPNDLESVLRQKALENLRRFRGEIQTNIKSSVTLRDDDGVTLKSLASMNAQVNQINSLEDDDLQGVAVDSSPSVRKEEKTLYGYNVGNDQMAVPGREKVNTNLNAVITKPRLVTSAFNKALSNATSAVLESPDSQKSNKEKLVIVSGIQKHKASPLKGSSSNGKINNASGSGSGSASANLSSCPDVLKKLQDGLQLEKERMSSETSLSSTAKDIRSGKLQDGEKEDSQLEQKTMSVMRGGEMVQVSYKVYIPKKAPALARRQLKR